MDISLKPSPQAGRAFGVIYMDVGAITERSAKKAPSSKFIF